MNFAQIFLVIVLSIGSFSAGAQETFEFFSPMSPEATEGTFQKKYQGEYKSDKTVLRYEITADDVIIHYTQYESMSKEYMDQDLKLYVIDSLLYGMTEKPLPVILENGRYHFGFTKSNSLRESGAVIKRVDEHNYVVNMKEGETYFPRLFSFLGRNLNISDFDYSTEREVKWLKKIDHNMVRIGEMDHYQLKPSQKDWERIIRKGYFEATLLHTKLKLED